MAVAPIRVIFPAQIILSIPAMAEGKGFTVTVTLLLFEQPVAAILSLIVYVVVVVGDTVGFAEVELNPAGLETQE